MFRRKCYHFLKEANEELIKFGLGGSLGLVIGNLFVEQVNNIFVKVLAMNFLCILIVSYVVQEIIRYCGKKTELRYFNHFDEYVFDEKFNKGENYGKDVQVIREAKILKITDQDDDLNFSIMLSALNCDIVLCSIKGEFSQECFQHIAEKDVVSVSLYQNNVKAILILDGLATWFKICA